MKALVIIDMQNDFILSNGKLSVPQAYTIINTIDQLRRKAYEKNIPVIYTKDWHAQDDPEFKNWPPHCIEDTKGAEIIGELTPREKDIVLKKNKLSAFDSPIARKKIGAIEFPIEEIFLTGVATEYCVRGFALDAISFGFKVNLVVDAVKGVDEIPEVPNTEGKVVYAAIEMGKAGVMPIYFEEAMKQLGI